VCAADGEVEAIAAAIAPDGAEADEPCAGSCAVSNMKDVETSLTFTMPLKERGRHPRQSVLRNIYKSLSKTTQSRYIAADEEASYLVTYSVSGILYHLNNSRCPFARNRNLHSGFIKSTKSMLPHDKK